MAPPQNVFRVESEGETLIVCPTGDTIGFQESDVAQAVEQLHEKFSAPGTVNLVVDLGQVTYLGSIMIGSIIALCKRAVDGGGQAVLCNASNGMFDALQIMKLDTVFPYFQTREAALNSLK